MAFQIDYANSFLKDAKKAHKRNYNMALLEEAVTLLQRTGTLPAIYKPHKLKGNYVHHWEAHIKPDWLIIWLTDEEDRIITLVRTGTHADLFK